MKKDIYLTNYIYYRKKSKIEAIIIYFNHSFSRAPKRTYGEYESTICLFEERFRLEFDEKYMVYIFILKKILTFSLLIIM